MSKSVEAVQVREVRHEDAAPLADLLNAIIVQGGTTALEVPFTPDELRETYLSGPAVHCCFIAVDADMQIAGFQTLGRHPTLPDCIGDIGTFAAIGGKQRGVGSALFAATRARAQTLGHVAINATIRSDNVGGLAFYSKLGFIDHSVTPAAPLRDGTRVDRINKRYPLTTTEIA